MPEHAITNTSIPLFALDPTDLDVAADDLVEEAEAVSPSSLTSATESGSVGVGASTGTKETKKKTVHGKNQQSEDAMANILAAASKAVQEKTDAAYKGYTFSNIFSTTLLNL